MRRATRRARHRPTARARAGIGAALALVIVAGTGCSERPPDTTLHAWLELGPGGERIARAVTEAATCPTIDIDGRKATMRVRAEPDPPQFPILTCEATVPEAAARAAIGDVPLRLPPAHVKRIVIIGDTGCRIQEGDIVQDCDNPDAWPFADVAEAVSDLVSWLRGEPDDDADTELDDLARSIAGLKPDLVVHVGDYIYREEACPDDDPGCSGSPYGYRWETMEADFFDPASAMLRAAPLVLARGNHELCNRGGVVWFRFLDPRPFDGHCVDNTDPYTIEVGGRQFLMLDSAAAQDNVVDPAQAALYRQQFEQLGRLAGPHSFLITHRPIWVFGHAGVEDGREQLFRRNSTLQVASRNELPPGVTAVISGHVHLFQALDFDGTRPPQIVVGNSGTGLDPQVTTPLAGLEIAGATVAAGLTLDEFGFATLEAQGVDWRLRARNLGGAWLLDCTLAGAALSCS